MSTDKFKALVHLIISECEDSEKLGAVRLNKILWFADISAYRATGASITGSKYLRRRNGPVPAHILRSLDELKDEGAIVITEPSAKFSPRIYTSLKDANMSLFSESEMETVREIAKVICNGYSADEISQLTHDDIWNAAVDGEEIPLEATLVLEAGDYNHVVLHWASKAVSNYASDLAIA